MECIKADEEDEGDIDDDGDDNEDEKEQGDDEEDLDDSSQMSSLVSKMKGTDFMKLAEGMDDLGESEEDEESADSGGEEGDGDEEEDEETAPRTFSKEKVAEEVEKGKAVKNQLGMDIFPLSDVRSTTNK